MEQQKQTPDHILAAQGGKKRGCIDNTHTKSDILFICTRPKCNKSRLVCAQCIQQNTHKHFTQWIEYEELMKLGVKDKFLNVSNWPQNTQIRSIYNSSISADEGNPDLIVMEQILDEMVANIQAKAEQMKKQIKESVISQQKQSRELLEYFKNLINVTFDLSQLQQEVTQFNNYSINIQELNQRISKFSDDMILKEKDILDQYKQQVRDKQLQQLNIQTLRKQVNNVNSAVERIQQNALFKISAGQVAFRMIGGDKDKDIRKGENIYEASGQTYNIMKTKTTFNRYDNYTVTFQLIDYSSAQQLYFGLVPRKQCKTHQYFWFQGGPQLCLKTASKQGKFKVKGKEVNQVFNKNQTYIVNFCVNENLFSVQDEAGLSITTYSDEFVNDSEEWKLVIGPNQQITYQIMVL